MVREKIKEVAQQYADRMYLEQFRYSTRQEVRRIVAKSFEAGFNVAIKLIDEQWEHAKNAGTTNQTEPAK
jgi:hypothetical protein